MTFQAQKNTRHDDSRVEAEIDDVQYDAQAVAIDLP